MEFSLPDLLFRLRSAETRTQWTDFDHCGGLSRLAWLGLRSRSGRALPLRQHGAKLAGRGLALVPDPGRFGAGLSLSVGTALLLRGLHEDPAIPRFSAR